jgi:Rrf2 family protein
MSKVINLSEAASIGIHGMILIARAHTPINVIKIAELTGNSRHHVAKIMQRLVRENFIVSQRGPSGGFMLHKPPSEISFLDIYQAIEGKIETQKCPMDKQVCPFGKCIMNNVMGKMTDDFRDYLGKQVLSDYLV